MLSCSILITLTIKIIFAKIFLVDVRSVKFIFIIFTYGRVYKLIGYTTIEKSGWREPGSYVHEVH